MLYASFDASIVASVLFVVTCGLDKHRSLTEKIVVLNCLVMLPSMLRHPLPSSDDPILTSLLHLLQLLLQLLVLSLLRLGAFGSPPSGLEIHGQEEGADSRTKDRRECDDSVSELRRVIENSVMVILRGEVRIC